jgi:hypothetical protein
LNEDDAVATMQQPVGPENSRSVAEIGLVQPINSWELNDRQCQEKIA